MILDPWAFVLVALVAFRVTRFLVFDSLMGFNLESKSKVSRWLDVFAYTAEGNDRAWWRGKLADLLVCPFCVGAWVSLALTCVWMRAWPWELGIEGWFVAWAVAGAQAMLNQAERRLAHG